MRMVCRGAGVSPAVFPIAMRKRFSLDLCAAVVIFFAGIFLAPIASPLAATQDAAAPNVSSENIHYDSGGFSIEAFVAKPAGGGKHPAILLIHDNQGLN